MGISIGSHFNFFNYVILVVIICCLSFLLPSFPTSVVAAASRMGGNDTDHLALLAFKAKITDDAFGVLSSWNESIHFCQWHGVTCGKRHQRVTRLDLLSLKLVGTITPHIGNLSFLRALNLYNNSFVGEIPPEIGRLTRLQILSLYNNSIIGKIPASLSNCSNLLSFNFVNNKLVGTIPTEIGSLSKLKRLIIQSNNLTGEIPHSFANLTSLEKLYAAENNFGGSIPDALSQLTNLIEISLERNNLSGTIPSSIFNMSSLTSFGVLVNKIIGSLPSNIGLTLPNLRFLGIANNSFSGSIPNSISNASNMEQLVFGANNFNGKVPTLEKLNKLQLLTFNDNSFGSGGADHDLEFLSSLANASHLRILQLDRNKFGGKVPESIGNLSTELEVFLLPGNHFVGSIPVGIINLVNLNWLSMSGNQLTGNIPTNIGQLQKLQILNLDDNKLNGSIPISIGNLTSLLEISLNKNNFQGSIPSSMGKMQNLLTLVLSNNNLSGTIPRQVLGLSSLSQYLDLSVNHLSGSLPLEVGKLINLGVLDVSENKLFGKIPNTIGSCVMLEVLYFEGNFFQGRVPSSLQFLRGIHRLDLSRNNFSGKIPEYLSSFNLTTLNLSFNDFEGEVPIQGIFKEASAISVMGNSKLCGGVPELQLPACNFKGSKKKRKGTFNLMLLIPLSCGVVGLILALLFLYLYCFRTSKRDTSPDLPENSLLKVSYQSLLKATNGFSWDNLIGAGSFGSVYKGVLHQDGTVLTVAVKVLNLLHKRAYKSFLSECEALRNIRHRNLVKVLTTCSGVDYQGNDFKALVYEFMENGNLDEWLHPIQEEHGESKNLSFLHRLNIAIDVASALDYLHHHAHNPIIHCDLKPSNILLNNEMTAHVGDFGLARFLPNTSNSNPEQQTSTSSIGVRGSIGYTAPEYGMGSAASPSGDVYSYGILLLEIFTGKRPTDQMFIDGLNLHNYVQMALPERVVDIADPLLFHHQEQEEEEMGSSSLSQQQRLAEYNKIHECLVLIFGSGLSCSNETPSERPDISGIAAKLLVIRNNFIATY